MLHCTGRQKKEKKKESFIFTVINLFRFVLGIWDFRTISWECILDVPRPPRAGLVHVMAKVGRKKVFMEFFCMVLVKNG